MKKFLSLLVILSCVGCSSTCKDGSGGLTVFSKSYHSCGMECCPKDQEAEKKECRCSSACPCWKKHN